MNDVIKKEELLEKINDALLLVKNDLEAGNNKTYKYDVSGAVINRDGAMLEEELFDETVKHGDLFREFSLIFGEIVESYTTFDAGVETCEKGLVAEQVVWDLVSFYLPSEITLEQLDKIIEEVVHRPNHIYEIYHNGKILDNCAHSYNVLDYLADYIENNLDTELSSKAV